MSLQHKFNYTQYTISWYRKILFQEIWIISH